jgi:hypothetical protein
VRQDSLRLDVGRPDHLGPLLGFFSNEFAEVGERHRHRHAAEVGKARLGTTSSIWRSPYMSLRADRYRERAAEAKDRAAQARDPSLKRAFEEVAKAMPDLRRNREGMREPGHTRAK